MKNKNICSVLVKTNFKLFIVLILLLCLKTEYSQIIPWKNILKANTDEFTTIATSNENNKLYIVSDNRFFIKTINNGVSFDSTFSEDNNLNALLPINNELIFAGYGGKLGVLKSTDDGNTWTSVYPIWDISELYNKGNEIWGGTKEGELILSTDLGYTWLGVNSPTNKEIKSFLIDSSTVLLGSYYGGYFISSDTGSSWDRISNFSGTGFIRQDSKRGLWLISNDTLYYSPVLSGTWISKGKFWGPINCFEIDPHDNLFISCFSGLFRSKNYGTSWERIAAFEPYNIAFLDSTIFIMEHWDIYVHEPGYIPVHGKNMFPLSLNNTYQYFDNYSNNVFTIKTKKITMDTIINCKTYYKFSDSEFWYNYNPDSNKAFIRQGQNEDLYCDFNLLNGSTFKQYVPQDTAYRVVGISEDSINIFEKLRKTIEWGTSNLGYFNSEKFAEELGIIEYTSTYSGVGPDFSDNSELINALIYDSLGNYTFYSENIKPEIDFSPLNNLALYDSNKFTLQVKHKYNRIYSYSTPFGNETVYIDTVYMEYCDYTKGNSPIKILSGQRTPLTSDYKFSLVFDTSKFKLGDTIKYRIVVRDKELIPAYFYAPNEGYFLAIINSLTSCEDNKTIVKDCSLYNNYPNPFNPTTRIKYRVNAKELVTLEVYNILGKKIKVLVNEIKNPGEYEVNFNASELNLPSGIYFYRLIAGTFTKTKKMILIK